MWEGSPVTSARASVKGGGGVNNIEKRHKVRIWPAAASDDGGYFQDDGSTTFGMGQPGIPKCTLLSFVFVY